MELLDSCSSSGEDACGARRSAPSVDGCDDSDGDGSGAACRICYDSGGALLAPCDCGGSMRYVHASCLGRWLATSRSSGCDQCCNQPLV